TTSRELASRLRCRWAGWAHSKSSRRSACRSWTARAVSPRASSSPTPVGGSDAAGRRVRLVALHAASSAPRSSGGGCRSAGRSGIWLNDRLMAATNGPPGIAHLERADLADDLVMARDFDLGITGPPLSIAMDFVASGLVEMVAGIASAFVLFGFAWWAPPLL